MAHFLCLNLYFWTMKNTIKYTGWQMAILVILRMLIGWHLLIEGIAKLLSSSWSSAGFLSESQWILSGFSNWIISHPGVLNGVDIMNTWGLMAIGAGLILGLFTRIAAVSGALLLLVYYLNNPPLIGLNYSVAMEGNYLVVSKTLIEAVALLAVGILPTSHVFGLDHFIYRIKSKTLNG